MANRIFSLTISVSGAAQPDVSRLRGQLVLRDVGFTVQGAGGAPLPISMGLAYFGEEGCPGHKLVFPCSPTPSLGAGPLHPRALGRQPCLSPKSSATPLPQPGPSCPLGPQPYTSSTPYIPSPPGAAQTLGPPTLGREFQHGTHSTTDAFISKTYSQTSRGRVLAG